VGIGYRLGEAVAGAGQREAAERLWTKVAADAPQYAPARIALARAYAARRMGREAAAGLAAALLAEALEADPGRVDAQWALAGVMEAMGRRSSALYQRGLFFLQTDRPLKALRCYRQMAVVNPSSTSAPLMASFCWMQVKRYREAAREAERGLRAHPGDPALRQRVAQLYLLTGNGRAAKTFCRAWLREEPSAAEPHRLLGRAAVAGARPAEAVPHFERAVALEPRNAEYHRELGQALVAAGDGATEPTAFSPPAPTPARAPTRSLSSRSRRAEAALRQAVELAPGDTEAHRRLGLLLQRQGRLEASRDELLRALDLDPDLTAAASALVAVAAARGEPSRARLFSEVVRALQARGRERDALQRAVGLRPEDAASLARLADLRAEAGDLRRALYPWEQLVALRPGDRTARQRLAVARRLLALREP
jgi:tetratricopeptide (TPR) repeat protein